MPVTVTYLFPVCVVYSFFIHFIVHTDITDEEDRAYLSDKNKELRISI